jgi:hypothetical protein
MGRTVVGQEDADFETIPEGTATDEFKAAKAEHLFIERSHLRGQDRGVPGLLD